MPFKEMMYDKFGKKIDACPFIFEVELDEVETYNNVKIAIKPLDHCVVITRHYYEFDESEIDPQDYIRVKAYDSNFFYNDEEDKITLSIFNGFDVAIFNICSLLGIGRLELDDYVPYRRTVLHPCMIK